MIAVCNTADTEKVIITSGAVGEIEMLMHIEISNTGAITFVVDPYAITATKKDLREHNESAAALDTAKSLESRVSRVEDGIFNNITGNPHLVCFDSLDGIILTKGIWNAERKRIEC